MKPEKQGEYIQINGKLYPVTGGRQKEEARAAMREAKWTQAPITYWDGSEWTETGMVLHAPDLTKATVVYGFDCDPLPPRTAALTALCHAVRAHRAMWDFYRDDSGWGLALEGEKVHTAAAIDACARVCASVLPAGRVGGELIKMAIRDGRVPGLEV